MCDKSDTGCCKVLVCIDIISMWSFDCERRKEVKNKETMGSEVHDLRRQTAKSRRLPAMQILCSHPETRLADVLHKKCRWWSVTDSQSNVIDRIAMSGI